MKLRLGVIGAGSWAAASHLPNLERRRDEVDFIGVCRRGADELDVIRERFGFRMSSEDHTAVLDAGVDIVIVSSPSALHYEHARDALLSGAHVMVEKPFTIDSEQAWDLVHIARQQHRHLLVAFGYNYLPMVQAARRRLVDHGGVGSIETLSVSMASVCRSLLAGVDAYPRADPRFRPDPRTWSDPALSGGGYCQAQLTHALGLAMHLFDLAPESVHATLTTAPGGRVEQHCAGVVRWRGGAIGQLSGNATHEGADANRDVLRIHSVGDEGQFRLDMDADAFRYFRPDAGELGEIAGPDAGAYSCDGPPAALVDLALGKTDENLSPGELGARTVEIVEAIYRSARSGRVESCPGEPVATS